MEEFLKYLSKNKPKNIVIISGAGCSTNSGIPDYRSKNGIFSKISSTSKNDPSVLKKYIMSMQNEIKKAEPSKNHELGKILNNLGILKRIYTQNIDGLYQKAGVPVDKVVEFHGSFDNNNLVNYGDEISLSVIKQIKTDFDFDNNIDLLLVMGTSLQVAPFCALPNMVRKECCRVLIDIAPENAYYNNFDKKKSNQMSFYNQPSEISYVKFGKSKVTLRPFWRRKTRWKNQFIIKEDVDIVSDKISNKLFNIMET